MSESILRRHSENGIVVARSDEKVGAGISCNMDWHPSRGWHIITAIKLTPKAFQTAVRRCHGFYTKMLEDLHPEDPMRDQIAASVRDLKDNRVTNKVTSNLQQGF